MKYCNILFPLILVTNICLAQPPDTLWTRTYGGTGKDVAFSVQQTADSGYVVAGQTESFGPGESSVYLIKTDASGDTLWTRTYGGESDDFGHSVQQTVDHGYIVAGWTISFHSGIDNDVWLIKTDSSGDTLSGGWARTSGQTRDDAGYSVQQTADSGYIVAGYKHSFSQGYDVYLIKFDASGGISWDAAYGGEYENHGLSVQQTVDGGYIVTGDTWIPGPGSVEVYLIKTDSSGGLIWEAQYGGLSDDYGYSIQQTVDGGYIVAGETNSFGAGSKDFYLIKTDASGDTLWTRTYGGTGADFCRSVQQTADGGYIVAGYSNSFGAGDLDVYLIKTDASGDILWDTTYGGTGSDYGYSVEQTADGGYIVAGETDSFGAGSYDAYLIRLAPELQEIPTLSEWGMLIMALLLLAVGTAAVVRRRRAALNTVD